MKNTVILDRVISRNGITMRIEKVPLNPILGRQDTETSIEHYRCRLSKPGKEMDVYLSIGTAEGILTTSDVLFMLAMDAFGCRLLEGYEQFRDEWDEIFAGSDGNLKEIENFWEEYGGRCRQTEDLKNFLGESVYEEIVKQLDARETMPMMF